MWNKHDKSAGRFLLTMLLVGTLSLTGCSSIPSFSYKTAHSKQVAQVEGPSDNLKDVPEMDPSKNEGGEEGNQSGGKHPEEGKNPGEGSTSEGKTPDSTVGEPMVTPSPVPQTPEPALEPESGPSPQPAPANTPIRPFYELAGSPPTAPGLAMKQRKFKQEPIKIAYLTIDDGPSNNTARILKILQNEGVNATFFVIGRQVEQYPELLKQAYEQGNAIGNHTYSHNYAEIYKSPKDYVANIKKNEELIFSIIGIRPKVIRTPGGTQGNFRVGYYNAVDAEDYLVYDWNVSTGDAAAPLVPANQLIHNVMNQVPGKNRIIVLMHDAPGKTTTPEALPQIIQYLKKQGYEFGVLTPQVAPILFPGGFRM